MTKGFTLIEILVVVLIIGILAAIAVPQYQKAVAKAELAQIISLVRSIKGAQEVYYLTNGEYAKNINSLDLSLNDLEAKCNVSASWCFCYNKNFSILHYYTHSKSPGTTECSARTQDQESTLAYACKDFLNKKYNAIRNYESCQILLNDSCVVASGKVNF